MIGASNKAVIAHNTATGAVLWRKEMPGRIYTLRFHGGVVVATVNNSNTLVLDVATGDQVHTLPRTTETILGLCVFDGLTNDVIFFVDFLTPWYFI